MDLPSSPPEFRLPLDVIPKHYDLDILTYLEPDNYSFQGSAWIKIECQKPTDTIKVHARNLVFDSGKVSVISTICDEPVNSVPVVNTYTEIENEFYVVKIGESLVPGKIYFLHLPFQGVLKEDLIGYYRSSYFDHSSNSTKWLAVTHFEPSDARQAFPCFDEPSLKATFNIRLAHREQFKSVSNMPLKDTSLFEGRPGWVWCEFETTVPMSTYLVEYMVSEFEYRESKAHPNNITFRVWARRDAIDQTGFASTIGPHFLSFYEDFFRVKYPLPKQDLLAIPDFKIGAMENWGAITFRESRLLLDEKTTSSLSRLAIATVVAHEIAHMWFGNLVTMKWWTDLWLKEGFATFMAGLAVHQKFPEWNSLDASALSDLLKVFHLDSLKSSHPVSVPIGHSSEISQIFDEISYDKGSFLLRMISLCLGDEVFRHGVSEYLKKHQFSCAEQDDLWASLTEQAHRYHVLPPELSVKQIMDTWTLQTGYPLITVIRDYGENKAVISQRRYLTVKSNNVQDYQGSWWVPISYSTANEPQFNRTQPQQWLSKDKETMEIGINCAKGDWLILNNRTAGLYKINYDSENWELLISALESPHFHNIDVMNRAQLIIDAMDLAEIGLLDYKIALRIVTYVKIESAFVPWNAALAKLDHINSLLSRTSSYGTFKKFLRSLMTHIVRSLGGLTQEPATFEGGRLSSAIMMWACPLSIGDCALEAHELFNKWRNVGNPDVDNPIPKDVRRIVYSHAVEEGGVDAWDFLWERYGNTNVSTEKNNILMALTAAKDIWIINRYLEWTLDEKSGIRKQDAFIIFQAIAARDVGFFVAHKFFFRNIKRISDYYGASSNLIGHYFRAVAGQMIYSCELEELKSFAETYKELLSPASLTVSQGLETVQVNIDWMEKHHEAISCVLLTLIESKDMPLDVTKDRVTNEHRSQKCLFY